VTQIRHRKPDSIGFPKEPLRDFVHVTLTAKTVGSQRQVNQDGIRLSESIAIINEDRNLAVRADLDKVAAPLLVRQAQIHRTILVSDAQNIQSELHLVRVTGLTTAVKYRNVIRPVSRHRLGR
jgi:hypothetical protein